MTERRAALGQPHAPECISPSSAGDDGPEGRRVRAAAFVSAMAEDGQSIEPKNSIVAIIRSMTALLSS
jgi:hypothetical protein